MALPTLPFCWTHKSKHIEQQLSRMRQQHQRFKDQWDNASGYFQRQNVSTNIQSAMTSEASFRKSMDAYSTLNEKNKTKADLCKRRQKLSKMLSEENVIYEAELRNLSVWSYTCLKEMKERSVSLKSAREEKRKQIAKEKLYEHWKENNADLRKVENQLLNEHVKQTWSEQEQQKQKAILTERQEDEKFLNEYEEARVKAMQNIQRKEEHKLKEEKEAAQILRQQMKDLKDREEAAKVLKLEEEKITEEQIALEKMQEERKKIEEHRRQMQLQRFLHHQYKAQLRRKAQQVQKELNFDRKILEKLQEDEKRDAEIQSARRQKAKADVEWMKQVLEEQLRLEQQREAELDLLYREEARRMWEQREEEWRKEREAREKLMLEVLGERQEQITARAHENKRKQEDLLREREELLLDLEEVQKTSRREKNEEERRKQLRQQELESQMTQRYCEGEARRREEEKEKKRVREEEQDYERMLQEETEKMKKIGYIPKRRPRSSRVAWE